MSRNGVYEQFTSDLDHFTPEAAQWTTDHIGTTDWQNAEIKNKSYLKTLSPSSDLIHKQLTSNVEGFAQEGANYAIQHLDHK